MLRSFRMAVAALAVSWGTVAGAATLDGLDVDIVSPHGDCLGVTVGAGVECNIFDTANQLDDFIFVDIDGSSIVFGIVDTAGNGGSAWTTAPDIFDVVISGLTGFSILNSTLDLLGNTQFGGSLSAMMTGLGELTLSFDNFDVVCGNETCATLTVAGQVSAVPLPAGLPLLLAGLGAFGVIGRRRKNAA